MTSRRMVSWDGTTLNVERHGVGPPVVVLHGFTGSIETMRSLIDPLAAAHSVVAIDLPGHGRSDAPPDPERYEAAQLFRDLDAVLGALHLQAIALVGYSLGARLGLSYSCSRPDRVSRLVVIGAGLGIEDETSRRDRVASDETLAQLIEQRGVAPFVDRWMALPLIADQATPGSATWERARAQRLASDPVGLTGMLRGFGQGVMAPLAPQLGELRAPVLAIVGAEDPAAWAAAQRIAELAPNASVAVVPDAGHAPHLVQAEATAALVAPFLAGTAAP